MLAFVLSLLLSQAALPELELKSTQENFGSREAVVLRLCNRTDRAVALTGLAVEKFTLNRATLPWRQERDRAFERGFTKRLATQALSLTVEAGRSRVVRWSPQVDGLIEGVYAATVTLEDGRTVRTYFERVDVSVGLEKPSFAPGDPIAVVIANHSEKAVLFGRTGMFLMRLPGYRSFESTAGSPNIRIEPGKKLTVVYHTAVPTRPGFYYMNVAVEFEDGSPIAQLPLYPRVRTPQLSGLAPRSVGSRMRMLEVRPN